MKFKSGIKEQNIIVKCGADKLLPFFLLFGLYVILFGTVSPGGGFQGGVLVSSAALLLYLGYNYKTVTKTAGMKALHISDSIGTIIYVILGLVGLVGGSVFCKNIFFASGDVGDMLSAGNITFMSYAVGFHVIAGVAFLLLLMVGLLVPDMVKKDEVEIIDEEEDEE